MPEVKIPQFTLRCISSEYPNHLCIGTKYRVDPSDVSNNECATYWFHPMEMRWVLIGYFSLNCFNTMPIREWLAKQKGEVISQRQRPQAVVSRRQRPQIVNVSTRKRPQA